MPERLGNMGKLTGASERLRTTSGQINKAGKWVDAVSMGRAGGKALKGPGSKGFAKMRSRTVGGKEAHFDASRRGGESTSDPKREAAQRNIAQALKVRMAKRGQAEQWAKALAERTAKKAQAELEAAAQAERQKKTDRQAEKAERRYKSQPGLDLLYSR